MAESSRNAFAMVKEGVVVKEDVDRRQNYARERATYIGVRYVGEFVQAV